MSWKSFTAVSFSSSSSRANRYSHSPAKFSRSNSSRSDKKASDKESRVRKERLLHLSSPVVEVAFFGGPFDIPVVGPGLILAILSTVKPLLLKA